MAGLRLYISNRMESLIRKMAEVFEKPLSSPLAKEVVVVQSKGMERWVSMELASKMRVCANYDFLFPEALVMNLFKSVISGVSEESRLDVHTMTWMLMKYLPSLIHEPDFEGLRNYLHDNRPLKLYQLCQRIAETFDKYTIYRPEMILDWQKGKESHSSSSWQAQLWRHLLNGCDKKHFASLKHDFIEALKALKESPAVFPQRLSVFGISSLPPFYLEVFQAASALIDIYLYLMNPCREYWVDIASSREIEKISIRYGKRRFTPEELHLDTGNSLLASMGIVGREFFKILGELESGTFMTETVELFESTNENTLLEAIQSDILNLWERHSPVKEIAVNDSSVQVHICHSPMREMEALYDNLLAMFEADPALRPGDILIMTPDIGTCTPFIEAVFGSKGAEEQAIPFSIADRASRAESSVIDTFLQLLELPGSRFGASSVVGLLESPDVRRAFDFTEEDVEMIRNWVYSTRICWGIDGNAKTQLALPAYSENTWQAGQDRLMLGYCMKGDKKTLFYEILPFEGMDGSEGPVLGRFFDFLEKLFSYAHKCEQPFTPDKWTETFRAVLSTFFAPDETRHREVLIIHEVLNELAKAQSQAGFEEAIALEVIKHYLTVALSKDRFRTGFISGGITFCTMLPMRSIPFRVVCLVGMDNNAYPRIFKTYGFDLTARQPQPCDPGRTKEDRYLFLEAILSAREKIYISYSGQSIRDNSALPPSVLVSELMDYIDQGFAYPDGRSVVNGITVKHRLQAFHSGYFQGRTTSLFSYSRENCEASAAASANRHTSPTFFTSDLTVPDETYRTVDIEQLIRFFSNPARFLLNKRLGLYLEDRSFTLVEREPFSLNALEQYSLCQNLIEQSLKGLSLKDAFHVIQAAGVLPHGNAGKLVFARVEQEVTAFIDKVRACSMGEPMPSITVNMKPGSFHVTGTVPWIYANGLLGFRCASVKPKDLLKVWIYHLVMCESGQWQSVFVGRDEVWQFMPVQAGEKHLELLLEKYWEGLSRLLPFLPASALVYCRARFLKNKSESEALQSAAKVWQGNMYEQGEASNPYLALCFDQSVLPSAFGTNAEAIFEPLMRYGSVK
ncbi:MAG TPA: exodeoxyribonuclease V subunit gamma [Thermodesulfovibrionia bacterium]|nr:exodeoxyribonuclease V subunit gamma [Thermodesulfovibrionia bacterium]